ncbi:PAC2 family protein [Raineyella antarctica]|uniref:PAC2 family protein n=1 Tax=Raineyella antarctica TaxID=1577474 RepID=A0A1G6GQF2_9ACTN|nr:PAC2 family protein [Raineyella antarctica]SDB84184.1 PAC2 family protein [Raineyella antarctica]
MSDPRSLYQSSQDGWDDLRGKRPVLLVLLDGAGSAGRVQHLVATHLGEHCTGRPIARFDLDRLTQYADRRPVLEFEDGMLVRPRTAELILWAMTDAAGETFLVLAGPEPMLLWDRVVAAITDIITTLQVRLVVNVTAVPMRVPHTRPTQVFTHSADPELVLQPWDAFSGSLTVAATFGTYLEVVLAENGRRTLGIDVCVPYYLGKAEHLGSAAAALEVLQSSCGLNLVPAPLEDRVALNRAEIDAQVAATENGPQVLAILESGYDEFRTLVGELPSADELGEEFERFLAEHDRGRDTGDGDAEEG